MLQAQFMGRDVDTALNVFREAHSGTLSGMTRFRDHLDDMPATGCVLPVGAALLSVGAARVLWGWCCSAQCVLWYCCGT
jgi:hypothetical protein